MRPDRIVEQIEASLLAHGYRRSKARRTLLRILAQADHSLALSEIIQATTYADINRSSIYRGLDVLVSTELVIRTLEKGRPTYELLRRHEAHHHHLTCSNCGTVTAVHSPKLESIIKFLADKHDFQASSHTFEISGLCADCKTK